MSYRPSRTKFPHKTRKQILNRDPTCQLNHPPCTHTSTIADHITNHATATKLGWTEQQIHHPTNGQGVCQPCHNIKTQQEIRQAQQQHQNKNKRPQKPHPGLQ